MRCGGSILASSPPPSPAPDAGPSRSDAPGGTPLVAVENGILAKLECTNPCGSIKDRVADWILRRSTERGLLVPGRRIVEATSGNTGIAFAYYGRKRGHPVTIVMPESMTEERKQMLRALGADLILSSAAGSFAEAAAIRDRLAREHGWFNPDQFSNPLNSECHSETTGHEILEQIGALTAAPVGAFVAGVGTGGTLMGVGARLRTIFPAMRLVAVEPAESAVMSGGPPGPHGIYGIGDGFIPALVSDDRGGLDPRIDEVITIRSDDARNEARRTSEERGYCVGISSGANLLAARRLRERFEVVVTVFADGYVKYQSEGLLHCAQGRCRYEHDPLVAPTR
jgi:cysteine synthase A